MISISILGHSKPAFLLISIMVIVSVVDSQFVNTFYGTDLDAPGNLHLLLFISFVSTVSVINIVLLQLVKSNDLLTKTNRPLLLRFTYSITLIVQYTTLLILFITIFEIFAFHGYHSILSLVTSLPQSFLVSSSDWNFVLYFYTMVQYC